MVVMKIFTIKRRRDGGSWKKVVDFPAKDWQAAKRKFTELMSDDEITLTWYDDEYIADMLLEDSEYNIDWFEGEGLYVQDCEAPYYYSASRYLDTFNYDVFTWTIKRV